MQITIYLIMFQEIFFFVCFICAWERSTYLKGGLKQKEGDVHPPLLFYPNVALASRSGSFFTSQTSFNIITSPFSEV